LHATKLDLTSEAVARELAQHAVVLAPHDVVWPLGLMRPDLRFIVVNRVVTFIAFAGAGRRGEGELRIRLQQWVTDCTASSLDAPLYAGIVAPVDVVFLAACGANDDARVSLMQELLREAQPRFTWEVSFIGPYVVLSRASHSS
jgi:hypothetical protein